ncbi:MAG: NUDIX domain-containing protein [Candidatus Aenigmatarchaeota archaeon]
MLREKSAGAIIFRLENSKRKYLMLKKRFVNEYWDLPKGNVEKNESEEETVRREIEEETGIKDIKFIPGFRERTTYFYKKGKETVFKEVIFFLVETKEENVKLSYEHEGYAWLTIDEIRKRAKRFHWDVIDKAEDFLNSMK